MVVGLALALLAVTASRASAQGSGGAAERVTTPTTSSSSVRSAPDPIEFCTDLLGCFTRNAADVQRVAIDGFDGDDGVAFISTRAPCSTNPTVPLSLTFDGGVGSDELRICSVDACAPR